MKILISGGRFSLACGSGRIFYNLSKEFTKKTHDVTAVASSNENPIKNIKIYNYNHIDFPNSLKILSTYFNCTKSVNNLIKKEKFDVIQGQGESFIQDYIYLHGCYKAWVEDIKNKSNFLLQNIVNIHPSNLVCLKIENEILTKSNYKKIFVGSKQMKNDIIRYYRIPEEKISIIPPGIDVNEFNDVNKKIIREKFRKYYGLEDSFVLLFIGQSFSKKGLKYCIMSLAKTENTKLIVIGKDNKEPYVRLARSLSVLERIIFIEKLDNLRDVFFASDLFVFPTKHEPFGMVVTEAMISGLPVITTKECGASEFFNNGKEIIVLENIDDLANKIDELIKNRLLRHKISSNGFKKSKMFSWKNIANMFLKEYEL